MTQEDYRHPIAPPPELVRQWCRFRNATNPEAMWLRVSTEAAQWGADQELKACCELLELSDDNARDFLYSARRPKPPSLKEQALEALGPEPLPETGPTGDTILNKGSIERHRCIRRALEQLDD